MSRTRVKVCGITRIEDGLKACELGVDALGFIFAARSPRYVSFEKAWQIIREMPPFVTPVGVFVNSDLAEVQRAVDDCGLAQVQLHGNEPVTFCRQLKNWRRSLSISKAFRVGSGCAGEDMNRYHLDIDSMLLDTFVDGREGGTGKIFDWNIIERLKLRKPLILAGGLTPENVAAAVASTKPFAVDINSGVEDRPGVKNHLKLQAAFAAVAGADRSP